MQKGKSKSKTLSKNKKSNQQHTGWRRKKTIAISNSLLMVSESEEILLTKNSLIIGEEITAVEEVISVEEEELPKQLELDLDDKDGSPEKGLKKSRSIYSNVEVEDPLIGTPKEVQITLDSLAMHLQRHPEDEDAFNKIHAYMHKYLLGLVHKYYIRGYDVNDIYQETLIAISRKAVPNFNPNRGMSFLNFAKMCITRHIITLLNAANNRNKDKPMNYAISLDQNPGDGEDDTHCLLSNVITDDKHSAPPYKDMTRMESFQHTLETIKSRLSKFEIVVLEEYLKDRSYKEAARSVSKRTGVSYKEKSIDNALLRIRKKAQEVMKDCSEEDIPLLF